MTTTEKNTKDTAPTPLVSLTPTQIRGLKLAKDGDLFAQDGNKWTHLNATVTYARTDRFKERPIKVKFLTTTTLNELRDYGFLQSLDADANPETSAQGITMAGKMWLLKNK